MISEEGLTRRRGGLGFGRDLPALTQDLPAVGDQGGVILIEQIVAAAVVRHRDDELSTCGSPELQALHAGVIDVKAAGLLHEGTDAAIGFGVFWWGHIKHGLRSRVGGLLLPRPLAARIQ